MKSFSTSTLLQWNVAMGRSLTPAPRSRTSQRRHIQHSLAPLLMPLRILDTACSGMNSAPTALNRAHRHSCSPHTPPPPHTLPRCYHCPARQGIWMTGELPWCNGNQMGCGVGATATANTWHICHHWSCDHGQVVALNIGYRCQAACTPTSKSGTPGACCTPCLRGFHRQLAPGHTPAHSRQRDSAVAALCARVAHPGLCAGRA